MNWPLEDLVSGVAAREAPAQQTRAAARLMTLLEQDPSRLPELFRYVPADSWPEPRLVLGITGAPGSGKSSLTDALVRVYRERDPEGRIGVIAVDPSSPFTGGAVLGDRVRMMRHATDPLVFIRSLATRGHLGGLSLGVRGVLRVMALLGCETVIVETVGVGQSEVEVARLADLVLIVMAPGHGDSIQLLKAGLMEVGDLFVVNKADRDGASQLFSALLASLSLADGARIRSEEPRAPSASRAFLVSATEDRGLQELVDHLQETTRIHAGRWQQERGGRILQEVEDAVLEEARRRIQTAARIDDYESVLSGRQSVAEAVEHLLNRTTRSGDPP